jgi:hypothetical protein
MNLDGQFCESFWPKGILAGMVRHEESCGGQSGRMTRLNDGAGRDSTRASERLRGGHAHEVGRTVRGVGNDT